MSYRTRTNKTAEAYSDGCAAFRGGQPRTTCSCDDSRQGWDDTAHAAAQVHHHLSQANISLILEAVQGGGRIARNLLGRKITPGERKDATDVLDACNRSEVALIGFRNNLNDF